MSTWEYGAGLWQGRIGQGQTAGSISRGTLCPRVHFFVHSFSASSFMFAGVPSTACSAFAAPVCITSYLDKAGLAPCSLLSFCSAPLRNSSTVRRHLLSLKGFQESLNTSPSVTLTSAGDRAEIKQALCLRILLYKTLKRYKIITWFPLEQEFNLTLQSPCFPRSLPSSEQAGPVPVRSLKGGPTLETTSSIHWKAQPLFTKTVFYQQVTSAWHFFSMQELCSDTFCICNCIAYPPGTRLKFALPSAVSSRIVKCLGS